MALYARTPEELYDKELEALEQIDNATFRRKSPTVAEYCEKWLLMQSVHIRATTLTDYTSKIQRHITNKNEHTTFSKEEIKKLWNVVNHDEYMQIPLVLIYTGLRVGELWNLKTEDVHLADRTRQPRLDRNGGKQWDFTMDTKKGSLMQNGPVADRYFEVTKSKTDAGVRTVPIAEKIAPFFEHWLSKHTEYVFIP